jgi:predicted DsbA family dithiol-disulfide isomerase
LQPEFLKKYATEVGLDAAKFNACLDGAKYEARVQESLGTGNRLGITSTPTVYVNGRMVNGAQPLDVFQGIIDDELARNAK